MRASSSYIICSALCVCCSLSLCCAADTNRDEGKRVKDASRESDICIYHIQCMCAVEKQTQRSEVRSCKSCTCDKDLSLARARVKDRNERRSGRARVLSVWRRLEENYVEKEEEERHGGQ